MELLLKAKPGLDHYIKFVFHFMIKNGNYYQEAQNDINLLQEDLEYTELVRIAAHQTIPTNALKVLEGLAEEKLITNFETRQIEEPILQENACLRKAGSACFSDLDCAPNKFITNITSAIDDEDSSLWSILNPYEIKFWKENFSMFARVFS